MSSLENDPLIDFCMLGLITYGDVLLLLSDLGNYELSDTVSSKKIFIDYSKEYTEVMEGIFDRLDEGFGDRWEKIRTQPNSEGLIPGFNCRYGNMNTITVLLNGVDLEDKRYFTKSGSGLHYAIATKNKLLTQYLIEAKYPFFKENEEGLTPLDLVCLTGPDWAGRMLLEANIDVNHLNSKGLSPLCYAVKYHKMDMVRELIKFGAKDVDTKIFHIAVGAANHEIIKFCWENPEFTPTQSTKPSPIESAVKYGNIPMIEILLGKGFKIPEYNNLSTTAINSY